MPRDLCWIALLAIALTTSARGGQPATAATTLESWRVMAVLGGGRHKPLDTLANETLRLISNRAHLIDRATRERYSPTAAYLAMIFDWQGWDHAQSSRLLLQHDWRLEYSHLHGSDVWDRAPLLRVDFLELKELLELRPEERHISPQRLLAAKIDDELQERQVPFNAWATRLHERAANGEELTELEQKGLQLAERLWTYQDVRMGRHLEIVPSREPGVWLPLAHLVLTQFDAGNDPSGELRTAQAAWRAARNAYRRRDAATLESSGGKFLAALARLTAKAVDAPSPRNLQLEVAYNRLHPFRYAWVFLLASLVGVLLHRGSAWRPLYPLAVSAYAAGMVAALVGLAMRAAIAGRPPVTNMYESVIFVGTGVAVFGLVFELVYRKRTILAAGAAVSAVALVLADNCPAILDPSLRPLEPVLRSNFWLLIHVMTITLSYAAFALALGIANVTLAHLLRRRPNRPAIAHLSRFTYQSLQLGVLLLTAGTILGGVWADYSWGRFWGWDPKEVWALIALLGYLAVLHARSAGWIGHRGLAALSVGCFALVVMAWYGVNFVLGAGLHSYGFGGGGLGWVCGAAALQLTYVSVALARSRGQQEIAVSAVAAPARLQAVSAF